MYQTCATPNVRNRRLGIDRRCTSALRKQKYCRKQTTVCQGGSALQGRNDSKVFQPLGVGIVEDVKRKAPWFTSDFKDGINLRGVASTFFLFFGCLAPAVAFGGMMSLATGGMIGAVEMILATAGCGCVYALTSGQPITIVGSTGPVLALTSALYKMCLMYSLPFLPMYAWVGLWSSGMLMVCALTSTSNAVKLLTKFTDEIFSALIAAIFIAEALKDSLSLYLHAESGAEVALLSTLVSLTTLFVATTLANFRRSPYFNKKVRNTVADFAPTIGIVIATLVSMVVSNRFAINLPMLSVPMEFAPSVPRAWVVDLFSVPLWARWAAAIPGVMTTVLLFFDQNITTRLVNSSENRLKKGHGYHLDMAVLSVLTACCSVFGLPWLVAATVRSVNHLKSLSVMGPSPAGVGERIESVMENRLTGFSIHFLIGISLMFARSLLSMVPLAVLMGLFLYLGVSAIKGNSFLERVGLMMHDPELVPRLPHTTDIKISSTHKFTLIQIVALLAMYQVKNSKVGILFPVLIALLGPVRMGLEKMHVFTKEELHVLDGEAL